MDSVLRSFNGPASDRPTGERSIRRWVILTGEYPPQPGGVADYTRLVGQGLATAGDEVHVWAPPCEGEPDDSRLARAHRLPDCFGPRSLRELDRQLRRFRGPSRILVQYVPHAFGCKAMNVRLCRWLARRPEPVWAMFHEAVFPLQWRQPLKHRVLGVVTRYMARLLAGSAEQCFVTIPAWERFLTSVARLKRPAIWLPVPSNLPTECSPSLVAEVRRRHAPNERLLIGHFGTYGGQIREMLSATLSPLLKQDSRRKALLVGQNSEEFARSFVAQHPMLSDRVHAAGALAAPQAAAHLAACDCLVQPYPDGASARRGSLMAGMGLGCAVVTNDGPLSEPIWRDEQPVELLEGFSVAGFLDSVTHLLANGAAREALRQQAMAVYRRRFALEQTVATLRDCAARLDTDVSQALRKVA